jgi:hypothetical protein
MLPMMRAVAEKRWFFFLTNGKTIAGCENVNGIAKAILMQNRIVCP